ncbi:diacylglycerol kinase [Nocardioides salsibiostraticola]
MSSLPTVEPPQKESAKKAIALLANPTAGKGRGARCAGAALGRFRSAGWSVRALQGRDADEALDLARDAVRSGVDALVVCGGDGMVNLGLQATATTSTPLGIIPSGTGNDVARYFDLPRKDPVLAAERILAGTSRTIDLARCGGRFFATVMAAGFDALVNERANKMTWPHGQMRYNLATLAELRTFQPLDYTLELDGRTVRTSAMLVAIANGPSFGGGLRIAEGALLDDGLLDVVLIKPMANWDLIRTYPQLFKGTHTDHPLYEHHLVRSVTVAASGIVGYGDGERFGPLPLTIDCVPNAVRVLS